MTVLGAMVSLICLSFIFGIVSIPRQKRNPKNTDVTIILPRKKVTTASIPRKKVTTASIPKRKGKTTKSTITTTTRTITANICKTKSCTIAAATISKKMNMSVDPCVDFNEYACGRFIAETAITDGRTRVNPLYQLWDTNNKMMKSIIVQNNNKKDPTYLKNMKILYRSCTNEARIEQIGLAPYLRDKRFVDDWPTLNKNWKESSFKLKDVIARYEEVYIEPLFEWSVSAHMKDSNKNVLYLNEPQFRLERYFFLQPRNDTFIMAYQKYLAEVAVVLGANRNVAEQDAKGVIDLKIALSEVKVTTQESQDLNKQYNPVELVKLKKLYPDIDIPRAFRAAFDTANINLPDNETVIIRFPTYIGNLSLVIKNFPNRTLQNLFGFKYALSKVEGLTKKLRELLLEFDKVYEGVIAETPRWEDCLITSSRVFMMGMSKLFATKKFLESGKFYINKMIDNIEEECRKMINESTWMEQATKDEAYKKLKAIKRKIGFPDVHFEEKDIEKKYEKYTMVNNYYTNRVLYKKLDVLKALFNLRKPVDKNEWHKAPHDVNAYYSSESNEIAILAGFLQPPFYSKTFQDYMSYGAVGSVIGHEITHAFDDQGKEYDADGNLRDWWQPSDRDHLDQKTQCIIDQNSNFYIPEINMTLEGINLKAESVADNGGLKESFRAYKELVRKYGERPRLSGLNLTQDQIFFLSYAQLWCDKSTLEELVNQATVYEHPPGKFRIIGPLQNSEDFAKAYNCPQGSYMNPKKKCTLW